MNGHENRFSPRQPGATTPRKWFRSKTLLLTACLLTACGGDTGTSEVMWTCEVTLTLVPSRVGSMSSPSGSGRGTGTGATRDEALQQAYGAACSQLNLDSETANLCRQGRDFDRPPIVVPPTVLVQRPPEAWGEGRYLDLSLLEPKEVAKAA